MNLGRIAGIRVGVHWSVIAIWWLLAWSLSTDLLPDDAPGYGQGLYWLTAGVTALVLLACLLAHELSHALVARHHGVTTDSITLWVFGGVAQLREEPPSPKAELLVGAAGPAASFALAFAAAVSLGALDVLGAPQLVLSAVGWLALVNVVLAVFNLMPGFPLDGGRVLHAFLWWRSGDRLAALRSAATVGRGLGYGLIALGVLEFTAGYWTGLWLVLIGWFLLSAATAERDMGGLRDVLRDVRVADVMSPHPDVAPAWISASDLLDGYVMRLRHSSFPVQDRHGRVTGLVTLESIKALPAPQRPTTPVSVIAQPISEVVVARPDEPLTDLLDRLSTDKQRRALVLTEAPGGIGNLVGIVTPTDIARTLEYAALSHG